MAGVDVRSHPLPAAAAEPPARAAPVALVVFHRPAQLASHSRAADYLIGPPYCVTLTDRIAIHDDVRRCRGRKLVVMALNLGGILWNHRELKLLVRVVHLSAGVQFR